MHFEFFSHDLIDSYQVLEQLMFKRLGLSDTSSFYEPPPPETLSAKQVGIEPQQLKKAQQLIQTAINKKEKVLIFGDYDCDGITSTAIVWEFLYQKGLQATPFIPGREKYGYGLTVAALKDIWQEQSYDLVITVDNGIVAHDALTWLKEHQAKVLLTDHHQPDDQQPEATALVHTTKLAGAGVAWFLINSLDEKLGQSYLDLAVLGTVADQIPVVGVNRSVVVHGLSSLRRSNRPSLKTLAKVAGTTLHSASVNTIGFVLAPRINAVGRLANPMQALRALVDRDPKSLLKRWQEINELNQERRDLTFEAIDDLTSSLVTKPADHLVVAVGSWPEGLIGLIASRLVDQFHKPAIVLSNESNDQFKASCRSVPGVDITKLLRSLPPKTFTSLGGHAQAAGFSLPTGNWDSFLSKVVVAAKEQITEELLQPQVSVLGQLDWSLLNTKTVKLINKFAPFGNGNQEPIFALKQIKTTDIKPVGKEKRHAQVQLQDRSTNQTVRSICWRYQERGFELEQTNLVAVKLKISTYRKNDIDVELVAAQ